MRGGGVVKEGVEYENRNGELTAPSGKNDDTVISLALAIFGHLEAAPPVRLSKPPVTSNSSPHESMVLQAMARHDKREARARAGELGYYDREMAFYEARAKGLLN